MSSSEWKEVKLGDVCEFQKGFAFKSKDYQAKGRKIVKVSDLNNYTVDFSGCICVDETKAEDYSKYSLINDDIIITTVGSWPSNPNSVVGKVVKVQKEVEGALLNQNAVRVRSASALCQRFVFHLLKNKDFFDYIIGTAQGAANQASITQSDIKSYEFELPPLPEQKVIAATLSCLDDKIELNNRMNKNLEEMAQAIFKSWFVDFEPFQEGDFEESELGLIPKGWRVGTIGEVASISSGKRPPLKQDNRSAEIYIPVVGASSVMAYTSEKLFNEKILITGRVGTHGIIQRFNTPCWPSDNTLVIKSEYYEFMYQTLNGIDYTSMNRGSTQPLITQTDLKNIKIIISTESVLNDFEKLTLEIMTIWYENKNQNNILIQARDTLLPKLMSGEVRVPIEEVQ